jgi:4-oxalocrotonate tautomerase
MESFMPFIAVHIARGRPLEKRRRLAAAITDVVAEILELEKGTTQVLIHEHDRDNWAIGGELLSERQKTPELLDLDALFKKPVGKTASKVGATASPRKAPAKSRSRR